MSLRRRSCRSTATKSCSTGSCRERMRKHVPNSESSKHHIAPTIKNTLPKLWLIVVWVTFLKVTLWQAAKAFSFLVIVVRATNKMPLRNRYHSSRDPVTGKLTFKGNALTVRSGVVLLNNNHGSFTWTPDINQLGNCRNQCEFPKLFERKTRLRSCSDV